MLEKEIIFFEDKHFDSCHASTLVVLPNEEVVVAWFAGTTEGATDVDIWCSRRDVDGKWSIPKRIAIQFCFMEIIINFIYFIK